jgi:hypothetical protein
MLKRLKTATLIRHFHPVKKRAKAKKALTRLRTIANKLIRELQRKLPTHSLFETYQKDFLNQYGRLLGLFTMQGDTHFKNKIKTFNAYTLPKVHQLGSIARHTWYIV